ncbi:MAG: alpha/beta hydrolase [Pseudomonadota bacterium]|nr:alpha/beta hydrolase [Pseudomonadota bacterium]
MTGPEAGTGAPWKGGLLGGPAPARCEWLADGTGVRLRAALWLAAKGVAPRGHVILFPGRTEYLEKYAPLAGLLAARGFATASLDWRGQGLSDRAAGRLGHVDRFLEFQRDAAALTGWAPVAALPGPRVLVAHSMGGCIGLRAILTGALSSAEARPAAAIFSGPMWRLGLSGPVLLAARALSWAAVRLGLGRKSARKGDAGGTYVLDAGYEGNLLTPDRAAWDALVAQARAHPELTLAMPTFGWLDAAFAETAALRAAPPPAVPRLALLGSQEAIVSPEGVRAHTDRGAGAELAVIEGGRHETLMDAPDSPVGRQVWAAIDGFLARQGI